MWITPVCLISIFKNIKLPFIVGNQNIAVQKNCCPPAVTRIAGSHHILGIEHLLGELGYGKGAVLLAAPGRQGGETGHEEVETGKGDHVHRQLSQVSIQLTGEPQAGGHSGHGEGHQVVQIAIGRCGKLQGP